MTISKRKSSEYNSVNTAAICQYIKEYSGKIESIYGHEWNTLESVWLSQKCWFMTGSSVTVADENGNSQVFVRE